MQSAGSTDAANDSIGPSLRSGWHGYFPDRAPYGRAISSLCGPAQCRWPCESPPRPAIL